MAAVSATSAALFAEIDPLAYPARVRLFAARAHELAARGELSTLLAELAGGDPFARRTALFMATVVRDRATIARLARDPDISLRGTALAALIGLHPDATDLAAVLADAPIALRVAAYRALRRRGREALAAA